MLHKKIVAVVVTSYNSSKTIIETLNSILSQTYEPKFIELIISDDASTDDTVFIIDNWLEKHRSAFYSTLFFKNPVNLGVSRNVNGAWKAATSEWVKTIAGDDILFPDCICDNVDYVKEARDISAVFSEIDHFKVNDNGENEFIASSPTAYVRSFFELPASRQLEKLCIENFVPAPSCFLSIDVLRQMGYADERFKLIEDYPLWLKMTSNGYKLYFLDKKTVGYRISNSLSSNVTRLVNFNFFSDVTNVYTTCVYPKIKNNRVLILRIKLTRVLTVFVAKLFDNKKNGLSIFMMRIIYLLSPKHVKNKDLLKNKMLSIFQKKGP